MGQVVGLALAILLFAGIGTGLYLLIIHFHRKWYWEDEDRKRVILREAMRDAGIDYTVDDHGRATPTGRSSPRTSNRAK